MAEDSSARPSHEEYLNRHLLAFFDPFDSAELEQNNDLAMRTVTDSQAFEPTSSLDDSNYEILSGSGILSDDEGNTVSVTSQSIDGDTPDDFSSINDTGESETEDEEEHFEEETPNIGQIQTPSATEDDGIDESGITARPELSDIFTEFDQISSGEDGQLLSHTLPAGSNDETIMLRLAVSPKIAQLPRKFCILFLGDLYSYAGDSLIHQIAQALVLSEGPAEDGSPLTVTPVPSVKSPQTFQIRPSSGIEIQIDHCIEAKDVSRLILEDGSELQFSKDGHLQRITGDRGEPSGFPHLAIFLHSEQQRRLQHNATMRWARVAAMTNGIPTLDVAASGYFEWQELIRPTRGIELHVEIESLRESIRNPTMYLPVDIHMLSMISPSYLNRHLAYLMWDAEESRHSANRTTPQVLQSISTVAKAAVTRLAEISMDCLRSAKPVAERLWTTARFEQKAAIFGLIIMLILPMLLTPLIASSNNEVTICQRTAPVVEQLATSTLLSTSTSTKTELAPSFTQVIKPIAAIDTSVRAMIENSLGTPKPRLDSKPEAAPETFTAERISSSVFSITPPTFLAKSKKFSPSSVVIKVRRGSEPVPFKLMTITKPRVGFAVELEPEDAHGLLSVLISVNSKPKIVENLTIDFGNSWLGGPTWKNAFKFLDQKVRRDVAEFEKHIKSLSSKVAQDLQRLWEESETYHATTQKDSKQAAIKALKEIKSSAKKFFWEAKQEIKVISKQIQRELKAQKSVTKKLLQQSKAFAKQTIQGADFVRREVADACKEGFNALNGMMQSSDVAAPVRNSKGLKKLAANAKKALSQLATDDIEASGNEKKQKRAKADKKQKKAKAVETTKTYGAVKTASGAFKVHETGSSFGKHDCAFACMKYENGYIECTETGKCATKMKKKLLHKLGV